MAPSLPRPRRVLEALGLSAVLGLAAWVRVAMYARVLVGGELRPADADAEYHLRRVLLAVESWPQVSSFDPLLGWPSGAHHPWAPGFDWLGALWVFLTGARSPELSAALFPVVLGLLTVWASIDVARRLLPRDAPPAVALLGGVGTALVPQFIAASRLGRVDHHVAEALAMTLFVSAALRLAAGESARRVELAVAVGAAFALVTFTGAQLYVALLLAPLLLLAVLQPQPRVWGSGAAGLAFAGLLTLFVNGAAAAERGHLVSFRFPSLLQPGLTLLAAVALAGTSLLGRRFQSLSARLASMTAVFIVTSAAMLLLPVIGAEVREALVGWLAAKDPWLGRVTEFRSVFGGGRAPLQAVLFLFGQLGLLSVPLLGLRLAQAGREERRVAATFASMFGALLLLTCLQMRFGRVLSPLFGPAAVAGLWSTSRWLPAAPTRTFLGVSLFGLLLVTDAETRREVAPAPPRAPSAIEEAAWMLKVAVPPSPGTHGGVLAPWDLGSTLVSLSGRPVVSCGFGSYVDPEGFDLAESALNGDEGTLLAALERRDLGWVVTGASRELKAREEFALLMRDASGGGRVDPRYVRAHPRAILSLGGSGLPEAGVLHAEHLMPAFASSDQVQSLGWALPVLWGYEVVAGSLVTGRAPPHTLVRATLSGQVGTSPWVWTAWARGDDQGRFSVRLAVPSGFHGAGLATGPAWEFSREGSSTVTLAVSETAVRTGETQALEAGP